MARADNTRPENTVLGAALIMASVLVMSFADAMVKQLGADVTIWQIYVARSLVAIPILVVLVMAAGVGLRPRAPGWAYLRGLLLVLTWTAYYASLPVLKLSVAAVALYTSPLIIALLSALLIGEPVGPRRWSGIFVGFVGVVAILRPGTDAFSWLTLLPMLGAAFYAVAMIVTRAKCADEAPLTLSLALNVSLMAAGLGAMAALWLLDISGEDVAIYPFLLGSWTNMGPSDWGLMALLGILMVGYSVGVAKAYQIAAPAIVATFDYAYLVCAAFWGFVLFAETPGVMTIVGMILITVAGLLVVAPSPRGRRLAGRRRSAMNSPDTGPRPGHPTRP
jgi:drug/metabolite transporter (DMT)-like permease